MLRTLDLSISVLLSYSDFCCSGVFLVTMAIPSWAVWTNVNPAYVQEVLLVADNMLVDVDLILLAAKSSVFAQKDILVSSINLHKSTYATCF